MSSTRQYVSLTVLYWRTLGQRPGSVMTLIFGIACAVAGLVSMLAITNGARQQEMSDVRPDRAILLSLGALDGTQSSISSQVAHQLYELPGIRAAPNGRPIAVSEALVSAEGRNRATGSLMSFPLVGVTDGLRYLMPELRLIGGRMFGSGLDQLIASDSCHRLFSGFAIGDTRLIGGTRWQVVGEFRLGHADAGCMAYADASAVMAAFNRQDYNEVALMLSSPTQVSRLAAALKTMPALRIEAKSEKDAVREQYQRLNGILDFAAYFVGGIMAIGAALGAANSMYAIVDSRRRELATLRAFGFGSGAVLFSTLTESALLGVPGALIGAATAFGLFNDVSASPFGLSLRLAVTPRLALLGIAFAMVIGVLAGLLPGLRAARLPVCVASRGT